MSTISTSSLTSMPLAGFAGLDVYGWNVNGIVLASDATATTFSLACGSPSPTTSARPTITSGEVKAFTSPRCNLPTSLTVTAGPSMLQYNATGIFKTSSVTYTGDVTTTMDCTWGSDGSAQGQITPAPDASSQSAARSESAHCYKQISSAGGDPFLIADTAGYLTFDPVNIIGVVEATVAPTATVTSIAGAPLAASGDLAATGSLFVAIMMVIGIL